MYLPPPLRLRLRRLASSSDENYATLRSRYIASVSNLICYLYFVLKSLRTLFYWAIKIFFIVNFIGSIIQKIENFLQIDHIKFRASVLCVLRINIKYHSLQGVFPTTKMSRSIFIFPSLYRWCFLSPTISGLRDDLIRITSKTMIQFPF